MSDQTPKPIQKLADLDPLEAEVLRREGILPPLEVPQAENSDSWLEYKARVGQNATPRPYLDSYQLQDWAESRFQRLEDHIAIIKIRSRVALATYLVLMLAVAWLLWRAL